jgi:OmpA-OmpF porin, OOP family
MGFVFDPNSSKNKSNCMKAVFLIMNVCWILSVNAQSSAGERVKENAQWKTEQKVNEKVDKTIDNVLSGKLFKKKKKTEKSGNTEEEKTDAKSATVAKSATGVAENKNGSTPSDSLKVYRKFDFVQGEKILYYEDFERVAPGDFPTGWNTNSSAEIVTVGNLPGKWLSITKDGFFAPEMVKDMPDNFTLEFEVRNRYRSTNILGYNFMIYQSANPRKDIGEWYLPEASFRFNWGGCNGTMGYIVYEKGEEMGKNEDLTTPKLVCPGENAETPVQVKFALWRQKNRLRVYINEEKVLDIPQAFSSAFKYNVFKLGADKMNYSNGREHDDEFMVSNVRYAIGAPDTRNKLLTDGKYSTTGILFDVQKTTVKPESYGVLKEIANTLKENPTLKIRIIGHASNDGDANFNLELSKGRAASVKQVLVSEFGLDAARFETDGKGGSQPVDTNATPEGKANNRRVEFIKI